MQILKRLYLKLIGNVVPTDYFAYRYPVSVKGLIIHNNQVLLLKNERDEWDLPGGKLDKNEAIEACLKREILEETNLKVYINKLVDANIYNVLEKIKVLVICYQCELVSDIETFRISGEHLEGKFFPVTSIFELNIRPDYKALISRVTSSE